MIVTAKEIKNLLEARVNEATGVLTGTDAYRAGRQRFLEDMFYRMGLFVKADPNSANSDLVESTDQFGRTKLAEGRLAPEMFSLRELGRGIMGDAWVDSLEPSNNGSGLHQLLESGPGIDPTGFLDVSLFSATTAGLAMAKILEKFQNAAYVSDRLVEVVPTRRNGEKFIGTGGFEAGQGNFTRNPGMAHPRGSFGQRYVTTPETVEKALACEVTAEAVFYDQTNQVLQTAGEVGDALAYQKEMDIIDGVIGATNPYVYNGTGYNTYQQSSPWINTQNNALVDYDNIDKSIFLFAKMINPETNREIIINPTDVLYAPRRVSKWDQTLFPGMIRSITNTNTATYAEGPRSVRTNYNRIESQIFYNRLINSSKGVDSTKAYDYWYHGDFKGAFAWMENWPLQVYQAAASEYVMRDRRLIFAIFASHRGIFAVKEPRKVVENRMD